MGAQMHNGSAEAAQWLKSTCVEIQDGGRCPNFQCFNRYNSAAHCLVVLKFYTMMHCGSRVFVTVPEVAEKSSSCQIQNGGWRANWTYLNLNNSIRYCWISLKFSTWVHYRSSEAAPWLTITCQDGGRRPTIKWLSGHKLITFSRILQLCWTLIRRYIIGLTITT